jgi:hypothetical protein
MVQRLEEVYWEGLAASERAESAPLS